MCSCLCQDGCGRLVCRINPFTMMEYLQLTYEEVSHQHFRKNISVSTYWILQHLPSTKRFCALSVKWDIKHFSRDFPRLSQCKQQNSRNMFGFIYYISLCVNPTSLWSSHPRVWCTGQWCIWSLIIPTVRLTPVISPWWRPWKPLNQFFPIITFLSLHFRLFSWFMHLDACLCITVG